MKQNLKTTLVLCSAILGGLWAAGLVLANGGPFIVKHPSGDPAAKGVLARLSPDLKPDRESRLRVIKEDLTVIYDQDRLSNSPLVEVSAAYSIENPTDEEITVDFGFPILRGIYISPTSTTSPYSMMPDPTAIVSLRNNRTMTISSPEVAVSLDNMPIPTVIISNSAIYGIIRRQARETIEKSIKADVRLAKLFAAAQEKATEKKALSAYLIETLKWNERDAALLSEFAGINPDNRVGLVPYDRNYATPPTPVDLREVITANLGPLAAIGEQKATQLFAQLAGKFDPQAAASYESIFTAWGGDVRERAVDLKTGELRPREIKLNAEDVKNHLPAYDPTIYARVDYFDESVKISDEDKAACKNILQNLPVVFTFAPMNLLHYQVKFPAKSSKVLTVLYRQIPFRDTKSPKSLQIAYVIHPASLWRDFGPINLEVHVPEGIPFKASVPCEAGKTVERDVSGRKSNFTVYRTTLQEKTGELFLAVDAAAWENKFPRPKSEK